MSSKTQRFDHRQHMRHNTFEIFRYKDCHMEEVALHHHDFYEVYFFLSGNVQYNIENRSYLLTPGDVLLISPMELHQPVFGVEQRDYERIILWIDKHFLEGFGLTENDLAACFNTTQPGHTNLLRLGGAARQLLTFWLEQLLREVEGEEPYRELATLTYLAQVLILLNRHALRENRNEEIASVSDSVVYYIFAYINEHYSEDLSLDYLANKFFTSKYHLSREFQRLVGTSVHRYIIQKRLAMAKQMMSQGMPSTEVYQHCGFGDYSTFYRAFRNEYQISPKEFAAQVKEAAIQSEDLTRRLRERIEK